MIYRKVICNDWFKIFTGDSFTGLDLLSGGDLILSGSTTTIIQGLNADIKDGLVFIQDYNVWVKSRGQLIQLMRNGSRIVFAKTDNPGNILIHNLIETTYY